MRKILALLFFTLILSGCATYKFQQSAPASGQGYLVSYDGKPIIEYTVGKDKSLPDLGLAKERFRRRRPMVEYYYKKMGLIESKFKENFWDPPAMIIDFLGGILRWPFTAVEDYKYNHNPKYKERMDKLDEEREAFEKAKISGLKEKLQEYIADDLARERLPEGLPVVAPPEAPVSAQDSPVVPQPLPDAASPLASSVEEQTLFTPVEPIEETTVKPVVKQTEPAVVSLPPSAAPVKKVKPSVVRRVKEPPVPVIIAKPTKGFSPLKVKFSAQKSYSKSGKIVSYLWDFGDADTSTKKNPENTYWSATYGVRKFPVTLTVEDNAGGSSSTTTIIEVSTR